MKECSLLDQAYNNFLDDKYEIETKGINFVVENIFLKKHEFYLDDKLFEMTKKRDEPAIFFIGDSRDNIILLYKINESKFTELKEILISDFVFKDYSSLSIFKNNSYIITGGCKYSNYKNTASNSVYLLNIDENYVITFVDMPPMNTERFSHGSCLIDDTIYVFGK